ncbi:MAG: hypothetical protein ACRETQ_10930 [Gammaproteobacteria bacterium]
MTPEAVLYTASLCGLLTLAAFAYGGFYAASKLLAGFGMLYGAGACYVVVMAFAVLIFVSTPLALSWKILIVASALVYMAVPPVTWRFLVKLHEPEEQQPS